MIDVNINTVQCRCRKPRLVEEDGCRAVYQCRCGGWVSRKMLYEEGREFSFAATLDMECRRVTQAALLQGPAV